MSKQTKNNDTTANLGFEAKLWAAADALRNYCWMQSEDLKQQIDAVAGQTDMAPYVSLRDQRMMEVPIFPGSQGATAQRLDALLVRQALAAEENRTLEALRDALLPKLISGELRVNASSTFRVERPLGV